MSEIELLHELYRLLDGKLKLLQAKLEMLESKYEKDHTPRPLTGLMAAVLGLRNPEASRIYVVLKQNAITKDFLDVPESPHLFSEEKVKEVFGSVERFRDGDEIVKWPLIANALIHRHIESLQGKEDDHAVYELRALVASVENKEDKGEN